MKLNKMCLIYENIPVGFAKRTGASYGLLAAGSSIALFGLQISKLL